MTNEAIYDAITDVSDELIDAADAHALRKKPRLLRWAAAAAVLALAVGAGTLYGRVSTPAASSPGGGGGGEDGCSYMDYVGPVLPLTVREGGEGVAAARHVDYDFSPYRSRTEPLGSGETYEAWNAAAVVTDAYTLTNGTDEDRTLRLLYPVAASANTAELPTVTVDGAPQETTLYAGAYSGGFCDAAGGNDPDMRLNLAQISRWEEYVSLLSDGSYQAAAFGPAPDLNEPVTVYRIDNYDVAPTDAVNPSLQISFHMDYDKTVLMTYGSNGGTNDRENGFGTRIVGGLGSEYRAPEPMYLVLYGDDIGDYTLQGYANMGGDAGTEIDVTAEVTRYETTLDVFLRQIIDDRLDSGKYEWQYGADPTAGGITRELLYRMAAEHLTQYGVLSSDARERYFGALEEVFEAYIMRRVFYLAFDVIVPAGESAQVTAVMRRNGSRDFVGKNRNVQGYDLATRLGSTLTFTEQRASISSAEEIVMLENNFGFDPDGGVTEVVLPPDMEHCWMQVMKRS